MVKIKISAFIFIFFFLLTVPLTGKQTLKQSHIKGLISALVDNDLDVRRSAVDVLGQFLLIDFEFLVSYKDLA